MRVHVSVGKTPSIEKLMPGQEEMAQLGKCPPCEREELGSDHKRPRKGQYKPSGGREISGDHWQSLT